jgi:integrase/recombinase XerC
MVIIRSGKGDAYREIPLNSDVRKAVQAWLDERRCNSAESDEPALFLNRRGVRLSARTMHDIIARLGRDGGVTLSAHTLRHTCLTNLVRNGNDLVLVAELAGHRRIETTRRYSRPSVADRRRAMDGLKIEY